MDSRKDLSHIIIFVGPSGSGKSTLIENMMRIWPDCFAFNVSHTTRRPRKGEIDGKHYHFVSKRKFVEMLREGMFVEYNRSFAETRENVGWCQKSCTNGDGVDNDDDNTVYYGTSKMSLNEIFSKNKIVVMDTDIKGAVNMQKYCDQVNNGSEMGSLGTAGPCGKVTQRYLRLHIIFVKCPTAQMVEERLRSRGTETTTSLQRRLLFNRQCIEWYNANHGFFSITLLNDNLQSCMADLTTYVQREVLSTPSKM
ncbi:unnamed protein product [Trypanosoma congolense IL3000]|uniref:WGS project CAEQ00000000 data, annotated contig 252 n=1 Tax=Trypanosoma congolense (strain IL3000) TaxID=1068625 RepID=F9WED9_TRYCI|nr:unnamed protein product [Trypanosoma congolense IL3000]